MIENDFVQPKVITIFKTLACPKCRELINYLNKSELDFEIVDVSTGTGLAIMRTHEIFELEVPIMQVDNLYFTPNVLFRGDVLQKDWIDKAIGVKA